MNYYLLFLFPSSLSSLIGNYIYCFYQDVCSGQKYLTGEGEEVRERERERERRPPSITFTNNALESTNQWLWTNTSTPFSHLPCKLFFVSASNPSGCADLQRPPGARIDRDRERETAKLQISHDDIYTTAEKYGGFYGILKIAYARFLLKI